MDQPLMVCGVCAKRSAGMITIPTTTARRTIAIPPSFRFRLAARQWRAETWLGKPQPGVPASVRLQTPKIIQDSRVAQARVEFRRSAIAFASAGRDNQTL